MSDYSRKFKDVFKKIKKNSSKHGGVDKGDYCWFNNEKQFWEVIDELSEKGASHNL